LLALAIVLGTTVAHAAPRDAAATQKIDEAINNLYLATEFDKAEALLKGVLEACEDRCSPQVKARAWMYIGIVRGSGKQDVAGAQEAFQQGLALDPNVKLDDALATPAVKQAFDKAAAALGQAPKGSAAAPEAAAATPTASSEGGGEAAVPGSMECTPNVKEVESQRPIPVACTTDEPASKVTLRYMVFGGDQWQQVQMVRKGEYWQGEIPCADTGVTGKLRFYVQAKDKDGEELDSFGSKKQPAEIQIVAQTSEEPPSYPGQAAPPKCMEKGACPEDMIGTPACPGTGGKQRGNKGWGAACDTSEECDTGLLCMQGDQGRTCESAPSCTSSSDCPSGSVCKSGTCDIDDEGSSSGPTGPYKKNWVGLHVGADFAFLSGKDVCLPGSDFNCFFSTGTPYPLASSTPQKGQAGNLNGGIAPGTYRIMASYERILFGHFGAEGRLGFAFNGGPKAADGTSFLPVHLEARGKYWFGRDVFSKKGIRPYVLFGAGVAQVDAKLSVTVYDPGYRNPKTGQLINNGIVTLDAYRKLGQAFVTVGGGAMYAFGKNHGLVLNLDLMYMLPASGVVIQPSLGYQVGL
jgi:hypothetical protein